MPSGDTVISFPPWNQKQSLEEKKTLSRAKLLVDLSRRRSKLFNNLIKSFLPPFMGEDYAHLPNDITGAVVVVSSLYFLLLYIIYALNIHESLFSGYMLRALLQSYGGWVSMSFIFMILVKIFGLRLRFREVLSMTGYSFSSYVVVLVLLVICKQPHMASTDMFLNLLAVFTGLTALRIMVLLMMRTQLHIIKFLVAVPAGILHVLFLVHLKFSLFPK